MHVESMAIGVIYAAAAWNADSGLRAESDDEG